jgi:hypothetical protein
VESMPDLMQVASLVPRRFRNLVGGHVRSLERSESAWRIWSIGTYAPVKTRNFAILTVES